MDGSLRRSTVSRANDPHGWNSLNNYRIVHEKLLDEHPFLDDTGHTFAFSLQDVGGVPHVYLTGRCYCRRGVILEVDKTFETRYTGNILQIRGIRYLYIAWISGNRLALKYHNWHRNPDEYIHRVYDPNTGDEVFSEILSRFQFPVFTEVLDEAEYLTRPLAT